MVHISTTLTLEIRQMDVINQILSAYLPVQETRRAIATDQYSKQGLTQRYVENSTGIKAYTDLKKNLRTIMFVATRRWIMYIIIVHVLAAFSSY